MMKASEGKPLPVGLQHPAGAKNRVSLTAVPKRGVKSSEVPTGDSMEKKSGCAKDLKTQSPPRDLKRPLPSQTPAWELKRREEQLAEIYARQGLL